VFDRATEALAFAEALGIGAGAGMGVDSGLPDFRGPQGFWRAYPPYERLGLDFVALANPRWFREDPTLAWGFYGHRLTLYRQTTPHDGFAILRRWARSMAHGAFVFTSNVDGHFQRAGFGPHEIVEIHGSFASMQCASQCGAGIFGADEIGVAIDPHTMRAVPPLPSCPCCGALARPNILMFGDWGWDSSVTDTQLKKMARWANSVHGARIVVIECGAGQAVPTVRIHCEQVARELGGTLIRINPREPEVPNGQISIALGALAALRAIDERIYS
jgi:NAD-dependent SIR2 family protein deacetylase